MEYRFILSSSRGKKLWITAIKDFGSKCNSEGDLILNDINIVMELNIIDKEYKINYILKNKDGKQNFIDNLESGEDKEIIIKALQFADDEGLINRVIKRYNKK